MSTLTPDRTRVQRLEALQHANDVRSQRAQLKRDLKARRVTIIDLLSSRPAFIDTMKILDLLMAAPKIGRVKAARLLRDVGVSPSKTIGGLSFRQRSALLSLLRGRS